MHPGIILFEDGALLRADQLRLIRLAVATVAAVGDLVNKVLWIAADGSTRVEEVPPP